MDTKTSLATIRGTMLVPGISKNRRDYKREAIGRAVERMQYRLKDPDGLPIVMRTHHEAGDDSRKIVGRIVRVQQESDGSATYEAKLFNNEAGRDLIPLITPDESDGKAALSTTSIHGNWIGPTERFKDYKNGPVETGDDLEINALDFTYSPGVPKSRISSVAFESTAVDWPIEGANVHDGLNIYESMEATITIDEVDEYDDDGYKIGEATYNASQRRQMAGRGQAMNGGRYPIANKSDLRKAIMAVGRGKGDHNAIRAYIIKRAKALGLSNMIPSNWTSSGSNETTVSFSTEELVEGAEVRYMTVSGIRELYDKWYGSKVTTWYVMSTRYVLSEHYVEVCVGDEDGPQIKVSAQALAPEVIAKAIKGAKVIVKNIMANNPDATTLDNVDSDDLIDDPDDIEYNVFMAPQPDTSDPNTTQDNGGGYGSQPMQQSVAGDEDNTSIKESAMAEENAPAAAAAPVAEAIDYGKFAATVATAVAESMAAMEAAKAEKKAAKKAAKAKESAESTEGAVAETKNATSTEDVKETITPEQLETKLAEERAKTVAELRETLLKENGIPGRKGYRGVSENDDGELTGQALWDKRMDVWGSAYPSVFGAPATA